MNPQKRSGGIGVPATLEFGTHRLQIPVFILKNSPKIPSASILCLVLPPTPV